MLYKAGDWNICDGGRDDVRDDKKEMAEELLSSFIHEMQDLGFEKMILSQNCRLQGGEKMILECRDLSKSFYTKRR